MPETVPNIYQALNLNAKTALLIEMDRLAFISREETSIERIAKENLREWGYQIDT